MRKLRQAGRLVKEWSAIRLAALVKGKRMTQKEAPFDTFIQGKGTLWRKRSIPPLLLLPHPPPIYPIAAYSMCSPLHFCLSEGLTASLDRKRTLDLTSTNQKNFNHTCANTCTYVNKNSI